MNILFVIDKLELKYFEFNDLVTNFWFIKEFLLRGYSVDVTVNKNLFIKSAKAFAKIQKSFIKDENIFYKSYHSSFYNVPTQRILPLFPLSL